MQVVVLFGTAIKNISYIVGKNKLAYFSLIAEKKIFTTMLALMLLQQGLYIVCA